VTDVGAPSRGPCHGQSQPSVGLSNGSLVGPDDPLAARCHTRLRANSPAPSRVRKQLGQLPDGFSVQLAHTRLAHLEDAGDLAWPETGPVARTCGTLVSLRHLFSEGVRLEGFMKRVTLPTEERPSAV
jgi:hypothetical protein